MGYSDNNLEFKGGKKTNQFVLIGLAFFISAAAAAILVAPAVAAQPLNSSGNITTPSLDASKITTTWNLSFLYKDKDDAKAEYQRLNRTIRQVNQTFRPRFEQFDWSSAA